METTLTILLVALIAGVGTVIFLLLKVRPKDMIQDKVMDSMKQEIENIRQDMKGSLEKNLEFVQKEAGRSNKTIAEVTSKLEKLDATNKQVINFTDQLKNLQQVLTNPKQRGVLGEYYLETLLQNVLPVKNYQMQYKFKDGEAVDAAIFVGEKLIPVDSKFSLENYNRLLKEEDEDRRTQLEKQFKQDLKLRIDETSKYIRPGEKTFDFAFMFIPAEGIYYDLLVSQVGAVKVSARDLLEYAFEKKVLIVSPNSFYAYLQTVLQGLRAMSIEESAKEIRENVEKLGKHLSSYDMYMQKLGSNLGTTVNMYNQAYKEFGKVDKDVMKVTGKGLDSEPVQLDKPR
jgi:DNA recombination protein RmuC